MWSLGAFGLVCAFVIEASQMELLTAVTTCFGEKAGFPIGAEVFLSPAYVAPF